MVNAATHPAAAWLLESNHPYDTSLNQDLNADGIPLLMAYALDLNPNERLTTQLPQAELNTTTLSLQYYTGAAGITYRIETSKDMVTWITDGVTISDPDGNGVVTASIPRDEVCGFLRLIVEEE